MPALTMHGLLVWIIVGAVAGSLAATLLRGFGYGLIGNTIVGIIGAVIAGWLLPRFGLTVSAAVARSIVHATIGAVILLVLIGFIRR
jgi:uncharacterized membrane protein YeaQ/YmgE (transglycosylase-associated protein family)